MGAPLTVFRATFFLLLVIVAALSYACGDDDGTGGEPAASFPAGSGGGDDAEAQEFSISLADNTFEPAEFTVTGGVVVQFNIVNGGVAIHNMRTDGADNVFNNEDDALSDPPLVNGGETAVLQWAVPVAGGTFEFRCDFHPEAMVGTITAAKGEDSDNAGQEGP